MRRLFAACLLSAGAVTAQAGQATFELAFTSTWSQATHPFQWPSGAHYSPLVGATHDAGVSFWANGGIATPGIENMAELGWTSTLGGEIAAAGHGSRLIVGPGLGTSPAVAVLRFTADARHPLLTLVSMLAPSPDWFVGVSGLDLRPGGVWVDDLTVQLEILDSGTDSGTTYRSSNADITPHLPIAALTTGPFATQPRVVGSFRIRRVSSTLVYGCGLNPAGSLTVSGQPELGASVGIVLDDPTATLAKPAQSVLMLALAPHASFPCGFALLGGEFLLDRPFVAIQGPLWSGAGVPFTLNVPDDAGIVGLRFYAQGGLVDATPRIGLTDAVELLIGP